MNVTPETMIQQAINERLGIPEEQAYEANKLLHQCARYAAPLIGVPGVIGVILEPAKLRSAIWQEANDTQRTLLTTGKFIRTSLNYRYQGGIQLLHFYSPDELAENLNVPEKVHLAAQAISATQQELQTAARYISSELLPWTTTIHKLADEADKKDIEKSTRKLRFSNQHIDSSDMFDPHPVHKFVTDRELSPALQAIILNEALQDTDATQYKPHVWRSMMKVTLQHIAKDPTHPLRRSARLRLYMPEEDADFNATLLEEDIVKEERERLHAESREKMKQLQQEKLRESQVRIAEILHQG